MLASLPPRTVAEDATRLTILRTTLRIAAYLLSLLGVSIGGSSILTGFFSPDAAFLPGEAFTTALGVTRPTSILLGIGVLIAGVEGFVCARVVVDRLRSRSDFLIVGVALVQAIAVLSALQPAYRAVPTLALGTYMTVLAGAVGLLALTRRSLRVALMDA